MYAHEIKAESEKRLNSKNAIKNNGASHHSAAWGGTTDFAVQRKYDQSHTDGLYNALAERLRCPRQMNEKSNCQKAFGITTLQSVVGEMDSGVIQRASWQSDSLQAELDSDKRYYALRGQALTEAKNSYDPDDWDFDEYDSDEDLSKFLSPTEAEELMYLSRYRAVQETEYGKAIHHMLPREKLGLFYDALADAQKKRVKTLFGKRDARGVGENDGRRILFSLRSNLVLGPDPSKRSDDPGNSFDATGGIYADVSKIYQEIDSLITTQLSQNVGERDNIIETLITRLQEAEDAYAQIQAQNGRDPSRMNLDVKDLWEKEAQGRYHKKRTKSESA